MDRHSIRALVLTLASAAASVALFLVAAAPRARF